MSFRDRIAAESRAEGAHLLDRGKRWAVYLTLGMTTLVVSLALFAALFAGADEPQGAFLGWVLVTVLIIHRIGKIIFRA